MHDKRSVSDRVNYDQWVANIAFQAVPALLVHEYGIMRLF